MSFRKKIIFVPYHIVPDNTGIIFILETEGRVLFVSPYLCQQLEDITKNILYIKYVPILPQKLCFV